MWKEERTKKMDIYGVRAFKKINLKKRKGKTELKIQSRRKNYSESEREKLIF